MTIKITNEGIICTNVSGIPDGTLIPWSYNPDADTSSSEEMRGAAAAVLRHALNDRKHQESVRNEYVNKKDYLNAWDQLDPNQYKEEGEDRRMEEQYNYSKKKDYLDTLEERDDNLVQSGWAGRKQGQNRSRKKIVAPSSKPKRIHNPVTGKYYEIRQRSSKNGDAGQIKGLWSSKKVNKKVK